MEKDNEKGTKTGGVNGTRQGWLGSESYSLLRLLARRELTNSDRNITTLTSRYSGVNPWGDTHVKGVGMFIISFTVCKLGILISFMVIGTEHQWFYPSRYLLDACNEIKKPPSHCVGSFRSVKVGNIKWKVHNHISAM